MVAVFGTRVSKGVEALLHSIESTWLDSVLRKGGDMSLHLGNFRNSSGNLLGSEGVWCGCGNAELGPKELGGIVIDGAMWNARLKTKECVVTRPFVVLLMVADEPETFLKGLDGVLGFLERLQGVGNFFFKLRCLSGLLINGLVKTNEGSGFSSFCFLIERDSEVWVFHPTDKIISSERRSVNHGKRRWRCSNLRLEQTSC